MPKLVLSLPDAGETVVELSEEIITLGRVADNTVQVEDGSVSSHHAELRLSGGDYTLRDLGSTNGTRVNGAHGSEWQLQNGDQVRFGSIEGVYQSENPAQARPIPQESEHSVEIADNSQVPASFSNASPFKTKVKKKDPAGMAVMGVAGLAILVFIGAVTSIFLLQPPA